MKRAPWLFLLLWACGPGPERPPGASQALSVVSSTATASASPATSDAPVPSAAPAPSVSAASSAPIELSTEQLASLTAELQSRRSFRHLELGNMPVRERNTWLLSHDSKDLTLTCELEAEGRIESGSPVPKRWFVVATMIFVTSEAAAGKTWTADYRRTALTQVRHAPPTLCTELGEAVALACGPASVRLHAPGAFVPVETRREQPVRWKPSTTRSVSGLGCDAKAPAFETSLYRSSSTPKQPMLFFADKKLAVERLVHSDAVQYEGFREATLTPFDGSLPEYLRAR